MTNPASLFPGGGGGSVAYMNGAEQRHDLSSSSYVATAADMLQVHVLYSSTDGKTFKLPDATTVLAGQFIGFRVAQNSRPIKIINAGTAGTDPILEGYGLAGSEGALFANSIATARGDWRAISTKGWYHGAVPVLQPTTMDAGVDLGSALANMNNTGLLYQNMYITRLSSTLYAVMASPNAGTSVVGYAVSYNHATDTWTWGAPVTLFSSANQWNAIGCIGLSATTVAFLAWEATNNKVSARAATISGTTITAGTTILSGAWAINPSNATCSQSCFLTADSASTFFYSSCYDGTHLGIIHFSVSGTTLTQDGGAGFASSVGGVRQQAYSPSANNLDMAIDKTGAGFICRYTYSAGSVTGVTMTGAASATTNGALWSVDAANRVYYVSSNTSAAARVVLNAGFTAQTEQQNFTGPSVADNSGTSVSSSGLWMPFTETEAIVLGSGTDFALFDPTLCLRNRIQYTTSSNSDSGFNSHVFGTGTGMQFPNGFNVGVDINQTNRRLAFYRTQLSSGLVANRQLALQMFDLPRNYDQAIF